MKIFTEKNARRITFLGIFLLILGLIFFLRLEFKAINIDQKIDANKFAQYGDFVGGVIGSLWALAGFILFYVALTEQRKDYQNNQETLKIQIQSFQQQIEEFRLQRQELELTREVFKEQSETLKIQQFESTFFNMLNLHHQIVNAIDTVTREKTTNELQSAKMTDVIRTSRDCFEAFYKEFRELHEHKKKRHLSKK